MSSHTACLFSNWTFLDIRGVVYIMDEVFLTVSAPPPPPTTKDFCHHQELKWYCSWQEHEQWLGIVLDLKESRDEERVLDLKESQRCKENTGSQRKTKREYWISNKAEDGEVDSFMWKTHPPGHTQYDYELCKCEPCLAYKKRKEENQSCFMPLENNPISHLLGVYIYKKRLYI